MVPINFEYDPDFLKEEERSGYLVKENIKKLWLVELDILNKFIQVCDKYGITYFADAGTLLGAVRHNGFIPWDDDIDIIMLRKDYDRFLDVMVTEFQYPYFVSNMFTSYEMTPTTRIYRLDTTISSKPLSMENKTIIYTPRGIGIDVFCADNCPDDTEARESFQKELEHMNSRFISSSRMVKTMYYRSTKLPELYKEAKEKLEKTVDEYDMLCKKYMSINTTYIFNISFPRQPMDSFKRRFKEDYGGYVSLPFEMLTLKCPVGYERCLDIMYTQRSGIPWTEPVKNYAFHNQTKEMYYDFDHSYTEYMKYFYNKPEDIIKTTR